MPYIAPEIVAEARRMDLLSYLKIYEPHELVRFSGKAYTTRTHGSLKTEEDYEQLIKLVINELGFERASKMHVHFSKIEYGKGGEIRHLTFADQIYGPEFLPLAKVIKKYGLSPVIICESDGTQADDALTMKATYENL